MYLPNEHKLEWLINSGKVITNTMLPEAVRLQAAVQHTEALERLETTGPDLATDLIRTYAAQIGNFMLAATDPSEPPGIRQYIILFAIKNGLHHISKAGAAQVSKESAFDNAAFSIAATATRNIDLANLNKALFEIMADPTDDQEVRRDACHVHVLVTLHEDYQFSQVPPNLREGGLDTYLDRAP